MSTGDLSDFSMLELFVVEVENHTAVLSEGLLKLESGGGDASWLEKLMRSAHSIKGAARIINLDVAVKVAHSMEESFVAAQRGLLVPTPSWVDAMLSGVDLLSRISKTPESDMPRWVSEDSREVEEFLNQLRHVATASSANAVSVESVATGGPTHRVHQATRAVGTDSSERSAKPNPVEWVTRSAEVHDTFATGESRGGTEAARGGVEVLSKQVNNAGQPKPEPVESQDRVIRISADHLNRLLGMCGESLVESRWLQPFGASLLRLKRLLRQSEKSIDAFHDAIRDLPIDERTRSLLGTAHSQIEESRSYLSQKLGELDLYDRRAANLSQRLYQQVVACRMRPFVDGARAFPRMVRDLARSLGKEVHFHIAGESTQVDRDVLERLEAPLTHLLRNAVDHGVESPEERKKAGKTETATVRLEARHGAGMLHIVVSDDGRGVDVEELRRMIVAKNLASEEMAARMNESELTEFLFLPGFSTKESVTEVSGRGVGLDVVQVMVRQVRGTLRAESKFGHGMKFHLQLPLTLSVSRMLLVEIRGEPYAIPLAHLHRTLRVEPAEIGTSQGRQHILFDGARIGLVGAHQVLGLKGGALSEGGWKVLVIGDRTARYGLVVDRFLEERELVIQPLDPRLGKIRNISSGALMPDGSPVLVLDAEDVIRSIEVILEEGWLDQVRDDVAGGESAVARKRILVVDDSLTVRELQRKLLVSKGYDVQIAVDGMEGLHRARTGGFDLVITDVDMPRMTGLELVQSLKSDPKLSHLPVMIVSYKDREEDRLNGMRAGAARYLTKGSFHDDSLMEAVESLIGEAA